MRRSPLARPVPASDHLRGRSPGAAWVQGTLANARAWRAEAMQAAAAYLRELLPAVLASQAAAEGLRSFVERCAGRFAAADLAGRCLDEPGADAGAAACLPEEVERDLGRPIGLRIDVGFASHILKLAGPAGDHSHRWVGEHGRGVD
jgi:hypothetical protein